MVGYISSSEPSDKLSLAKHIILMNLFTVFTAAVDFGQRIVSNWCCSDIVEKPGRIEFILPKKQALFKLNVSQFIKKCVSSPISPESQNPQILSEGGIGGLQ